MTYQIERINVVQGSDAWLDARKGVLTASKAAKCFTASGKISIKSMNTVANEMIGEIMGGTNDSFTSSAMQYGIDTEPLAIEWLEDHLKVKIKTGEFYRTLDKKYGFSPDGIYSEPLDPGILAGVEIKCPQHKNHFKYLSSGEIPFNYRMQMAYSMYLSGISHFVFCSFRHDSDPFVKMFYMNDEFRELISEMLEQFNSLLEEKLFMIRKNTSEILGHACTTDPAAAHCEDKPF